MKKLLASLLLVAVSLTGQAYQVWSPAGTSDTHVEVNPKTGKPTLKQDLIDNVNSGQTNRTFGYVFGRNSNIDNVVCDLWEGPTCQYVFPATAQQMAVVSSSANDDRGGYRSPDGSYSLPRQQLRGPIGSGHLERDYPGPDRPTNILRINSLHVQTVGSGGAAAGNISVTNAGGTVTYAYLKAGYITARQAIYTVPAGVYGYISHWQASSGAATGSHFTTIEIKATSHIGVLSPGVFQIVDEVGSLNNSIAITLPTPIRIPATADVKMSAVSDSSSADVQAMGAIMGWFETIE